MQPLAKNIELSVVSPVYESEELIDELIDRLLKTLGPLSNRFEIILVDDGSLDGSWGKIEQNCRQDPRIKGVKLSRNFGQHAAITAGLELARGQWIVVMDCDLQDMPEEISCLYSAALKGYDIVSARRVARRDSFLKCLLAKLFYRALSFLSGTRYDHQIANFGIYHRVVIEAILQMKEKIRYFPAMVNWVGFRKTSIAVKHAARPSGRSSYNFKKQFTLAVDIALSYSDKPLRFIIGIGFFFSLSAFVFGFFILYRYLTGRITVLGYASLITSLCFFSGVIVSVLGIIGLYIGKIFEGIKNRPTYLIRKTIDRGGGDS